MVHIKKKERKKEILKKIYSSLTIEVNVEKKKEWNQQFRLAHLWIIKDTEIFETLYWGNRLECRTVWFIRRCWNKKEIDLEESLCLFSSSFQLIFIIRDVLFESW